MHPIERNDSKKLKTDEEPFKHLKISDWSVLDSVEERSPCTKCGKSRKYFCYVCYVPVKPLEGLIPRLKLPIKIDIVKHRSEIDGKSTAAHAALLAPEEVTIYEFPRVPDYSLEEGVVLVYPGKEAKTVHDIMSDSPDSGRIRKAVFIDSTWNQSKGIYKDERIRSLPTVILKNKVSQFWRHQKGSPRWYLATIEAIHELLIEIDMESEPDTKQHADELSHIPRQYDGKYDDLLYFFSFMYSKIHTLYDHDSLLSYKRPLN